MPTKDKKQVSAHLPKELAERLKQAAKADQRTVSAMIAVLLERALKNG